MFVSFGGFSSRVRVHVRVLRSRFEHYGDIHKPDGGNPLVELSFGMRQMYTHKHIRIGALFHVSVFAHADFCEA